MSKTAQWIANSLFILSCIFLPWRHGGGHGISGYGYFSGYFIPLLQPDGATLDSLVFVLQLILIGAIALWIETLSRSDLDNVKLKYIGFTLAIAEVMILFPPYLLSAPVADSLWRNELSFEGFGFLIGNSMEGIIAPRLLMPELIALFGLSTLALKYHTKRIAARPVALTVEDEKQISMEPSSKPSPDTLLDRENIKFA